MKRILIAALVAGTSIAAAAPANAAILLYYSTNGTTYTTASGTTTGDITSFQGTTGSFSFNYSGSGDGNGAPGLDTSSLSTSSSGGTGGTLYLYVVQTGLNAYTGGLASALNSNVFTGSTTSATISTGYSPTGLLSPTSGNVLLQTHTFNGANSTFNGLNSPVAIGAGGADAVEYAITFGAGSGKFTGTGTISAVPELATWGMMIAGFGMMGVALRRRKTSVSFA